MYNNFFTLFTVINFVNYLDRGAIGGAEIKLKESFNIDNTKTGLIPSVFMIGFIIASPFFSHYVRKINPILLILFGQSAWCIGNLMSGLIENYSLFLICRSFVGIGEAAFVCLVPPLIDNYFERNKAVNLSIFYATIPIGYAFGFIYSGIIINYLNWNWLFIFESFFMFILMICLIKKYREINNLSEEISYGTNPNHNMITMTRRILKNKVYRYLLWAYSSYTFVIGSYSFWGTRYVFDQFGMSLSNSDYLFGGITVITGLAGSLCGGYLLEKNGSDRLTAIKICSLSVMIGFILCTLAFLSHNIYAFSILITIGEFFLFLISGPINSLIMWTVQDKNYSIQHNNVIKSLACSISVFVIHVFGDIPSPPIVAEIQDSINNWDYTMSILSLYLLYASILFYFAYRLIKKEEFNYALISISEHLNSESE